MHPLLSLSLFWLLPLVLMLENHPPLDCVARRTVPYHRDNGYLFREEGVSNYSIMLLREDLGLLMLGAREAIYALDLNNISNKKASVGWEVTDRQQKDCKNKGKDSEIDCKNYIRILHTMEDGRMYVCGTNAFDPECDYMSYADGNLTLENKAEDGKGKCPFDPFQRYSSVMIGGDLYSATSVNFLGSEPIVMRSSTVSIRTEFKSSWLHEPTFVSMSQMPESENSSDGDDDKVYLFFSETAVEYDFYSKLSVSRVARVCKGDGGGQRTLQKKWTSFLKAMVDCPVQESQLPYIIQDTYRWCESQQHWKSCLFYAVFTPQSGTSDLSAVCVYNAFDISKVFSEGKYKYPVPVETAFVKWVMYTGEVPFPRPGACIDNKAREQNINQTVDLPDGTLQFVKDKPLMDQIIEPIENRPLLVRRGAAFTRIIVNQVQAADGKKYHVMFIGTEDGAVLKAVNYDGRMFIIEEVQLFQPPEPIKVLQFSNVTNQLYAGSEYGAVQMPLATCGRSLSCVDCVLARDPYCGWDKTASKYPVKPVNQSIALGSNLKLHCPPPLSNLAKISWQRDALPLHPSTRLQHLRDGLLIISVSASDAGRYSCLSAERSDTDEYTTAVAEYQVRIAAGTGRSLPEARRDSPSLAGLHTTVGILVVLLVALLSWNLYKGHLPLPWKCKRGARQGETQDAPEHGVTGSSQNAQLAEGKPLVSRADNSIENNHSGGEAAFSAGEGESVSPKVALPSLQYIDDESEI
ncbi:semaphorin-4E [Diretmus argenteus]